MTLVSALTLLISMIVLAAIPGPGVMVVVSRTLSGGFRFGAVVAIGIVMGDIVFITLAIFGLAALANTYYELFLLIKYIGAGYLIYLGLKLLLSDKQNDIHVPSSLRSHSMNVFAGLVTTLSNPKAILFYLSFFPSFLSPSINAMDLVIIYIIAVFAVGGVMLSYAFLASKGKNIASNGLLGRVSKNLSGLTLVACGSLVASKA